MQQKNRNLRLTTAITSLVAMLCYFISYFQIGEEIKAMFGEISDVVGSLGELGGMMGEEFGLGDILSALADTIFSDGNTVLILLMVIFLVIVPLIMNLVAAILGFVAYGKKDAKKGSAIYVLITAIYTLVADIVLIIIFAAIKKDLKEQSFGFSDYFDMPISLSFGFYVQIVVVIATLIISIMAIVSVNNAASSSGNGQTLSQDDVGLIGLNGMWQGAEFLNNSGETLTIGRDSKQCDIVISQNAQNISRKHCSVRYDYDREDYIVVDYSSNGTYIDDKKLVSNVETHASSGSTIALGDKVNSFKLN